MITAGIDEVGRGCWAGPVVAGAVVLNTPVAGLTDSKKLTKARRESIARELETSGACVGIGWVSAQELDAIGLTEAVRLAMQRALDKVTVQYDEVIIDGSYNFLPNAKNSQSIIKADGSIPAVSAASIVAKVARDNYMAKLPEQYAMYAFDKHVGYGTAAHVAALKAYGVSDLHRKSFKPIKALLQ